MLRQGIKAKAQEFLTGSHADAVERAGHRPD
jgi:hypothetical protein